MTENVPLTDAACYLGITAFHCKRLCERGDLPHEKDGDTIYIPRDDLERFKEQQDHYRKEWKEKAMILGLSWLQRHTIKD